MPLHGILVRDSEKGRESRDERLIRNGIVVDKKEAPLVRFGELQIREYPPIVGDNPGADGGPALAIDWEPQSEVTVKVAEYEELRPERRTSNQMLLSATTREQFLRSLGYARSEIVEATKVVNVARGQRRRTRQTLHLIWLQEMEEKIVKKIKNILSLGKIKREERKFLEQYVKAVNASPEDDSLGKKSRETTPASIVEPEETLFLEDDDDASLPIVRHDLQTLLEADEKESVPRMCGTSGTDFGLQPE